MTYNEIIRQALNHLEYGDGEDQESVFFDRFITYANDAIQIIANELCLEQVDTVQLTNNHFHLSDLSKPLVTKICEVYVNNRQYPFVTGNSLDDFVVGGVAPTASVSVRYRWMPQMKTRGDDVPDIPAVYHGIIWLYIVYCHNNSRSSGIKGYSAQTWLAEFERQRKAIRRKYGAYQSYKFKNLPWQTGEI